MIAPFYFKEMSLLNMVIHCQKETKNEN